ncbi:MAG: DUF4442 domain-containing protein [Pseudomonadota bacterium]
MNHRMLRLLLNIYPPYWGTGIVVSRVAPDFTEIEVDMKQRFYNRNYVNTHFGGSLYAMVDPFYMLMLIHILGKDYVVWDKSASIDFVKPGKGDVKAVFSIGKETISDIIAKTADGAKYLPELTVEVKDRADETGAIVVKTIYVRKKQGPKEQYVSA